jgi:DNA polymerase large subunit
MKTEKYFDWISEKTEKAYDIAEKARDQSKDPEHRVDIPVATDLPEKASSLVMAAKFEELEGQGIPERIRELEDEFGKNDERVAFQIAREIAEGSFYDFEDREKACNAGIRVGVSYMTGGITTAPLEGIGEIKIRENNDGTEYLAVYYSGPIRSAGGTASAMSVLLSDYVRIGVGLDRFKPSETVVNRYGAEVEDYYNRVTAKQYNPTRDETQMIAENVPVEVTGSPTEDLDVSNYKDLDRVETNKIRGGMCLVYLDGLPLKAPKIKKRIEKWGSEFGLEHWEWVGEYLDFQKEIHSDDSDDSDDEEEKKDEKKHSPSDKYLGSLTAGRPIFGHPGRKGGFRLRYGRSRTNGLAAVSFHPATMEITERFIAIGTQLKTEYPGKATVGTPCDAIHPPIVRLENGDVMKVKTREKAKELEHKIEEILFLGDILVPYGEFVENGKKLLPSPYVSEWWEKELEKALEEKDVKLGRDFTERDPNPKEAFKICEVLDIPLHPRWSYHWSETSVDKFKALYESVRSGNLEGEETKQALEDILMEHRETEEGIKVRKKDLQVLNKLLDADEDNSDLVEDINSTSEIPEFIEKVSSIESRRQAPTYIGARMGRPEKAEKRTIKGKPQLLFPCGKKEGGRMRNLTAAYKHGTINEGILQNKCMECDSYSFFSYCRECGNRTEKRWFCSSCGKEHKEHKDSCKKCGNERLNRYKWTDIDVEEIVDEAKDNLGIRHMPKLLKSVRGMSGKHKTVEPVEKGILRQKHGLYVNKDATVRYDAIDIPMTHFKPEEIDVSVETLREYGYKKDINDEPLERDDQILEMKPQDIVIPDGDKSLAASDYMISVTKFVDELLEDFYGLEPYYNIEEKEDLVGELVIGLAPHTSGGTVGRIIGFTDAKGIYAHPYWHAAKRRNCLPGDVGVKPTGLTLKQIFDQGSNPREDDESGTIAKDIDIDVLSYDENAETPSNLETSKAVKAYKMEAPNFKIRLKTVEGKELEIFPDHRMETSKGKKRGRSLEEGDMLIVDNEGYDQLEKIQEIEVVKSEEKFMYDIEVENTHNFMTANRILSSNCDGDEDAILMLMDGLLNFSRDFLPDMTGARSVTKDTRIFAEIDGEMRSLRADELIDSVLDNQGYETREDGFEVNREFEEDIKAVSFDEDGEVSLSEVSALIRHKNDKEVFELKTSRGQISVTEDHSVFVTEGENIEAKPVREISEGDCIIVPSNFNLDIDTLPEKIDLFDVLPDQECYILVPEEEQEKIKPKLEERIDSSIKEEYGENNVYRYKTGRRNANLKFYKDVGVVPSCKVKVKANSDPINRYFESNEYLFRLLGYLMSEGNLESGRIYNNEYEVLEDIQECVEELTGVKKEINTDSSEGKLNDNYWLRIPKAFTVALNHLGMEFKTAADKSIPSFVLGADEELKKEFIQSYRTGDGSIYPEKGFSKLYTNSGEMASQLSYIVRNLGFKSSTRKAGDCWEVLYSEWRDKDPYWPLWDIQDSVRDSLRSQGYEQDQIKQWMSNYRTNNRMKTAGKEKIENLYKNGVDELQPVVEGNISVERVKEKVKVDYGNDYVYDLEVPENQNFLCGPHPVFAHNTMDAPLILSTVLNADEVDDEAWAIETVSEYPLEFYEETLEYKKPWEMDTDIQIGEDIVHSDEPYRHGFTHDSTDVGNGPEQSEYVTLNEMSEKTSAQLDLGEKLKAVDEDRVAELLLNKHFIPDIKGNLRAFSSQQMRCVNCNEKFRRVPMTNQTIAASGKTTAECPVCAEDSEKGKVILTISEGTIKKYMQPSKDIIDKYEISPYTRQEILIINKEIQSLFGKDNRQSGLKQFTS